jgi:hypothetical protein
MTIDATLDDISTHKIPEQALIAAVIALAVRDSVKPPLTDGKNLRMMWDATTAHDFLWTESLDSYLHWLDIDPFFFRTSLVKIMEDDTANTIGELTSTQRRAFRVNRKLWNEQYQRLGRRVADPESDEWELMESVSGEGCGEVIGNNFKYINGRKIAVKSDQANPGK